MCGRYAIISSPEEVRSYFSYRDQPNFPPRYNIAPTQPVPIVRMNAGVREFTLVRWGLVPSWAKEIGPSKPLINARAETLLEKPSFKRAAMRRRCLFPVDGFYEWRRIKGDAPKPYYIHRKDGGLLAFAGIWEHWQGADGSEIESAAIITTKANQTLAPIHHRMPVILDKDAQAQWLDVAEFSATEVYQHLKPADNDLLTAYPVNPRVNKVANDDVVLLEEMPDSEGKPKVSGEENKSHQLSLF